MSKQPLLPTGRRENRRALSVSLVIVLEHGLFPIQLRDQLSHIDHPGYLSFFGGHVDPGESHHDAALRELQEELTMRNGAALEPTSRRYLGKAERTDLPVTEHFHLFDIGRHPEDIVAHEGTCLFSTGLPDKLLARMPAHQRDFLTVRANSLIVETIRQRKASRHDRQVL